MRHCSRRVGHELGTIGLSHASYNNTENNAVVLSLFILIPLDFEETPLSEDDQHCLFGGGGTTVALFIVGALSISRLLASPSIKYSSIARFGLTPCTARAFLPGFCVDGDNARPANGGAIIFSCSAGTNRSEPIVAGCGGPDISVEPASRDADLGASSSLLNRTASNNVSPGA